MGCHWCKRSLEEEKKKTLLVESPFTETKSESQGEIKKAKQSVDKKEIEIIQTAETENPSIIVNNIEKENINQEVEEAEVNGMRAEKYDYDDHSRNIFQVINKMRENPKKFIPLVQNLIDNLDPSTNSIKIDSENLNIVLPEKISPKDSIEFLNSVLPKPPLLWSCVLYDQVFSDLIIMREKKLNLNDLDRFAGVLNNVEIIKIFSNFIVNPEITMLLIIMISEENRGIIFSDKIYEGAIATLPIIDVDYYTNEGSSLFYFIKPLEME